jgi:hypothetical protein
MSRPTPVSAAHSDEADRVAGFLSDDRRPGDRPSPMGDVSDPKAQQITPAELTVDGEVEEGKFPCPAGDLKANADRPDLLELEGRLGPDQPPLVPGRPSAADGLYGPVSMGSSSRLFRNSQSASRSPRLGAVMRPAAAISETAKERFSTYSVEKLRTRHALHRTNQYLTKSPSRTRIPAEISPRVAVKLT